MRQHLRIEDDKDAIRQFLVDTEYPVHEWIEVPEYLNYCLTVRIDQDGSVAGYLWAHFDTLRSVTVHAAVQKGVRVDWPTILYEGGVLAYAVGANEIHINLEDVVRPEAMRRILRRAGFSQDEDNPNLMRKELPWDS